LIVAAKKFNSKSNQRYTTIQPSKLPLSQQQQDKITLIINSELDDRTKFNLLAAMRSEIEDPKALKKSNIVKSFSLPKINDLKRKKYTQPDPAPYESEARAPIYDNYEWDLDGRRIPSSSAERF
jgi:hypothetical protein